MTGDVTKPSGSGVTTLANIPAIPGTNLTGTAANLTAGNATLAAGLSGTLVVGQGGTGVATSGTTSQIAVGGGTASPIVWTTATGTGAPVRATSPTLVTPTLGAATATTLDIGAVGGHRIVDIGNDFYLNNTQGGKIALYGTTLELRTSALDPCVTVANSGNATFLGGVTVSGSALTLSGNQSVPAWTTNGLRIVGTSGTFTDTSTAINTTVPTGYTNKLGGNTIAATNTGVIYTNYISTYVSEPVAGTNVTLTNKFGLGGDSLYVGTSNPVKITSAGILSATNASFTTPALGTPSAVVLTNASGTLPAGSPITVRDISADLGTLIIAGPRAREVLAQITTTDLSNAGFPWLTAREIATVAGKCYAMRVNYVGELGWELHAPVAMMQNLYDAVWQAGEAHGMRDFGLYAMDSLRVDKCYRGWKSDLESGYTPLEASLDRFVDVKKASFVGREALLAEHARGPKFRFVPMLFDEDGDAEAPYCAQVFQGDTNVGLTTSGVWSHTLNKSVALAYVRTDLATPGTVLQVEVLGQLRSATVQAEPLYDPKNERLRA